MTPHPRFPPGFRAAVRSDVRRLDDGRLLVGGSPMRAVRLSQPAQAMVRDGTIVVDSTSSEVLAGRLLDANLAVPVLDGIAVAAGDLTVVVPVRDRPGQLDHCLAGLGSLRVVVVDDASRDPDAVARVARRHSATLVVLRHNQGPAGARNAGLAAVDSPYVAFVDSDVRVEESALLRLARHLSDRQVALVGPAVRGRTATDKPRWFERYDAAASSLDLGRRPCSVRPGAAVGWLPSACLVGRASALDDGFAPELRVGEDVDLVWRLVDAGHSVRYDPSVVAWHDVRTTVRAWLGRKVLYGTGGAALASRHGSHVAPAVMPPVAAAAGAALLVRRWWSLPVAVAALLHMIRSLSRSLPDAPPCLPMTLAVQSTGWAVRQETGLLLRHWWPVALVGSLVSRHVRRAVVSAVVVDLAVFHRERPGTGVVTALAGRRLDDWAYGAGLWLGAARSGSARSLRVRWVTRTS